ncbi:MAG: hypothetical protein HUU38_13970 [Anaerolineales bacterium]|nr:hypothetical protein [Anaerolineales bacterium]
MKKGSIQEIEPFREHLFRRSPLCRVPEGRTAGQFDIGQADVDRPYNVWWLNTSHPYAAMALKKAGGPKGLAFKSHHLSMFRDMVQREALRILQRREAELPLDKIENELDEISNRFLAELPIDLIESLLE